MRSELKGNQLDASLSREVLVERTTIVLEN